MATETPKALAAVGAGPTDLDPGQSNGGAPVVPVVDTNRPTPEQLNETAGGQAANAEVAALAAAVKAGEEAAAKLKAAQEKAKTPEQIAAEKKAADEAAEAAKKKEPAEWDGKEYANFEDPSANAAIEMLKEAKVSPVEANAIFQKAIESGNLADVDWAVLESRVGKTKAHLIRTGVEAYYNGKYSTNRETVAKAYEIIGGEANWNTVKTWAQTAEKADPALKAKVDSIRGMIDLGGHAAEVAVRELKGLYEAAPNNKGLGVAALVSGDGSVAVAGGPLSRAEYTAALKSLHEGGSYSPAAEAALHARRRAGMTAGR